MQSKIYSAIQKCGQKIVRKVKRQWQDIHKYIGHVVKTHLFDFSSSLKVTSILLVNLSVFDHCIFFFTKST